MVRIVTQQQCLMPGRNGQIIFAAQGTAGKISKVWRGGNFHWLTQAFSQAGAQGWYCCKISARWYGARRRPETACHWPSQNTLHQQPCHAYSQRMHPTDRVHY